MDILYYEFELTSKVYELNHIQICYGFFYLEEIFVCKWNLLLK